MMFLNRKVYATAMIIGALQFAAVGYAADDREAACQSEAEGIEDAEEKATFIQECMDAEGGQASEGGKAAGGDK